MLQDPQVSSRYGSTGQTSWLTNCLLGAGARQACAGRLCEPPFLRLQAGLRGLAWGHQLGGGGSWSRSLGWGPALVLHATLGSQAGGAVCPGSGLGPDPQTPSRSLGLALHGENPDPDSASARRGTATALRMTERAPLLRTYSGWGGRWRSLLMSDTILSDAPHFTDGENKAPDPSPPSSLLL